MRRWFALSALLFSGSALAVDFDAPGQTLGRAVERLGAVLGRRLYVSAELRNLVVVVHVSDVSQADLLARIADVAEARWRETASGSVLERTPAESAALRRKSIAARAKLVTDYLKGFEKGLAKEMTSADAEQIARQIVARAESGDLSPMSADQRNLWGQGPAGRLTHRLLLEIDPALLVDIPFGGRRVFAFKPTKLQYGLGLGAQDAFNAYAREQNIWASTVASIPNPAQLNISSNPLTKKQTILGPSTDILLEVRRSEMDTPLFCNLIEPMPEGRPEVLYQVIVPSARNAGIWAALGPIEAVPPGPDLVRYVVSAMYRVGPVPTPSQEVLEGLYDPDVFDAGCALAEWVLADFYRGRDLVALVCDRSALLVPYLIPVRQSRERFEEYLPDLADVTLRHDEDWTLIEPSDAHVATVTQSPRGAVRRLMQTVKRTGEVGLEAAAELCAAVTEPSALAMTHLMTLEVPGLDLMGSTASWHVLRLYGALSSSQRRHLAQGGAVRYGDLPPAAQKMFVALTTSREIQGMVPVSENTARLVGRRGEPTAVLVSGVPMDASFTLQTVSNETIALYSSQSGSPRFLGNANPGAIASMLTNPEGQQEPFLYAMGRLETYDFTVTYSGEMSQTFLVRCAVPSRGAKPGPWTDLPASIVDEIKKAMAGGG